MREDAPVYRSGHRVVVEGADLEQVHKLVRPVDDAEGLDRRDDRFQAHPRRDAGGVKHLECVDAVLWQGRLWLPLSGFGIVQESESGGEGIATTEQIEVAQRPASALGQDLDGQAVAMEGLDRVAGDLLGHIQGLVGVAGKAHQHPGCDTGSLVSGRFLFELGEE